MAWIELGTWGRRIGFWGGGVEEFSFGQNGKSGHISAGAEKVKKVMKLDSQAEVEVGGGDLRVTECLLLEAVVEALWKDDP